MIDHAFKPHETWTTRDQCEHRLDEEKDGAYGICAAPRSEHAVATCEVCGRPSVGVAGSGVPGTPIEEVCFRVKAGADTTCYEIGYRRAKARAEKAESDFANACAVGRQHEARANTMEAMLAAKGKR